MRIAWLHYTADHTLPSMLRVCCGMWIKAGRRAQHLELFGGSAVRFTLKGGENEPASCKTYLHNWTVYAALSSLDVEFIRDHVFRMCAGSACSGDCEFRVPK